MMFRSPPRDLSPVPVASEAINHALPVVYADDESPNQLIVETCLRQSGFTSVTTCDNNAGLRERVEDRRPAVLLWAMSPTRLETDLALLREFRSDPDLFDTGIIVVSDPDAKQLRREAFEAGATEFLTRPLDAVELVTRVSATLLMQQHRRNVEERYQQLSREVQQRTRELTASRMQLVHCLARAGEFRDNETGRHAVRVGRCAGLLAEELGQPPVWCQRVVLAAMLHDIGKIAVPDVVLLKEGKLTGEEFAIMQEHCLHGFSIIDADWKTGLRHLLSEVDADLPTESTLLIMARSIALTHHERWDGRGYPNGLSGSEIPLEGRITMVSDVFDALMSDRPYKKAFPVGKCLAILNEGRGTQFDPDVVDAFRIRLDEILAIRSALPD